MGLDYHHQLTEPLTGKYGRVADRLAPKSRILELGCHTGFFSLALRARQHDVTGVELDEQAASVAKAAGVSVVVGDVERGDALRHVSGPFDAILMMDVLEHLKDPQALLRAVRPLLAQGGKILVTAPNIAYWAVRKDLLLGRWRYLDGGILDRTHLRFYNARGWRELLEGAGYRVCEFEAADGMVPLESRLERLPGGKRWVGGLRNWAMNASPELFAIQFLLEAVPG